MQILNTAGLLVINKRKLLLAFSNNKKAFYLPGGKTDPGETSLEALIREIQEELNVRLDPADIEYYTHISAPAFGEKNGIIMEQDCFLSPLRTPPVPAAEIGELRYFNASDYAAEPRQVAGVVEIIQQLVRDNFID